MPKSARRGKKAPYKITGDPKVLTATEFERRVPAARRLYRGVTNAAAAAASRQGTLGGGDFGRGIYTDRRIGTAQSYAGRSPQGVVMRMTLDRGAKVRKPPAAVQARGSKAIDAWADENAVDVVDINGLYQVIRNPAVLISDGRDYTVRETVVLDYLDSGYLMPEGFQPEIDRLRRDLGIPIPDVGQSAPR